MDLQGHYHPKIVQCYAPPTLSYLYVGYLFHDLQVVVFWGIAQCSLVEV